jgi:regulator of nucleoside diphosphate kinase
MPGFHDEAAAVTLWPRAKLLLKTSTPPPRAGKHLARGRAPGTEKPPIRVSEAEYEQLTAWAEGSSAPGAALLRRELDRAVLVKEGAPGAPFVRLNSPVEFEDLLSGRRRKVVLVAPGAADMDQDRLSVLAPAGAALLGLGVGDAFGWVGEDGRPRVLAVTGVGRRA